MVRPSVINFIIDLDKISCWGIDLIVDFTTAFPK